MNTTADRPAGPRRYKARFWLGGGLLAAVVLVGIGEAVGWPFLAGPLERLASERLGRQVILTTPAVSSRFSVRFLGGLRLRAPVLQIGAPSWSQAPYLVKADAVALEMRYADLWRARRGEPLRIRSLNANSLDGHLERLADGRASWQFQAPTAPPGAPAVWPGFDRLLVQQGTLHYRDEPLDTTLDVRLSLREVSATVATPAVASQAAASGPSGAASDTPNGLRAEATGLYRKQPVRISLVSSSLLSPGEQGTLPPLQIKLDASVGRASLEFEGQAQDPLKLDNLKGGYRLRGPSLAAVGDPVGVTLPTTGPFLSSGRIVREGNAWKVTVDDATIGASHLNGAFTYTQPPADGKARGVPLLSGRLGGSRLMLVDLGPVVGTTAVVSAAAANGEPAQGSSAAAPVPEVSNAAASKSVDAKSAARPARAAKGTSKAPGRVLPDRPFDLPAMRAMDANVLIDIETVDLNTKLLEPLHPLRAHLQLTNGVLTLRNLDARTADGRLMGDLRLDGRGEAALWTADLRWADLKLERWIRQQRPAGAPPYVTGRLSGGAQLQGQGRSTAQILGSLKGTARTQLRGGSVSHLVIEAAGVDLAQALGVLIKGDDALPVRCGIADLVADKGVLRSRTMVIDTSDSVVAVDGTLSLASEALDLRMVVSPKDFSPLTLRTPIWVRGSLGAPEVSLDKGPLGEKIATSALLALLSPLAALIPLIDTGNAKEAQQDAQECADLSRRARKAAPLSAPAAATAPAK